MNQHLHRLVFNSARGVLMAVAETAAGRGKAGGTNEGTGSARARRVRAATRVALRAVCFTSLCATAQPANAQIVADPSAPASQRATVLNAANGVPLVNIQTPSAAGVSRNTYSQFDVDARGAILNNSRTDVSTQLGGLVQGNPWLATGSARVILNEVNSSAASSLRGYIEVAGTRAQVVIANPAGISCDGCGFVNASRATLVTGTPLMNAGSLDAYRVGGGTVRIGGAGLDASRTDYTDVIARAVEVNAGLWANALRVTTGANQVDAAHTTAVPIAGAGGAPAFGLDVAALGGMYAGHITLVGTEAGVGVRNAGAIGASSGVLTLSADGRLGNTGRLSAATDLTLDARGGLANAGSIAAQRDLSLSMTAGSTNTGDIEAVRSLHVQTPGLDNTAGRLAGHDVSIDTGTQALGNAAGNIAARGSLALRSGALHNDGGLIQAAGPMAIDTQGQALSNTGSGTAGGIVARSGLRLITGTLDNTAGFIGAQGDLVLTATGVRNAAGRLGSDGALTARMDALGNAGGSITAGTQLTLDALALTGRGQITSFNDLSLAVRGDFAHEGDLRATRHATVRVAGALTQSGSMQAGGTLNLQAASIDNTGTLEATRTQLTATGALANRGLIDGAATVLRADSISNLGTGRIYGDQLALGAASLRNEAEGSAAPVIAARERLDLGVGTLLNREHATIFSAGDMAVGGGLDANDRVNDRVNDTSSGSATSVTNRSATIEALGSMSLAAASVFNGDDHFTMQLQEVSRTRVEEYALSGGLRYPASEVTVTPTAADGLLWLATPAGGGDVFTHFDFERVITAPVILTRDPGRIVAGGDLRIAAASIVNDRSHILAGGELVPIGTTIVNQGATDIGVTTETGSATNYWRRQRDRALRGRDQQRAATAPYAATSSQEVTVGRGTAEAHTRRPTGFGTTARTPLEVPTPTGVIRTGTPPLALPSSSLFIVNPAPGARVLIETDPRFTDRRLWLGSDFMLAQLGTDPATTIARLGDGFYEQQLVREQIAELTGRRFLADHTTDNDQYRALMQAGVRVGLDWNLRPGVALTGAQMAQLTTDIVWLVERTVTLPDGSTRQALVPQVYARARAGDLDGSGALMAGGTLRLRLDGELRNSGVLSGREVVVDVGALTQAAGRIAGDTVAVRTHGDLTLTGGSIEAQRGMSLIAGQDLVLATATSTASNASGTRTVVNRPASLYVGEGTLLASAARDVVLNAASVTNAGGPTVIAAGRDINLGTVTESRDHTVSWDAHNTRREASTAEVGSRIDASGDVQLIAARDLALRAAGMTSTGALTAQAGRDASIVAGESTVSLDEAHRHTTTDTLRARQTTTTTRDTLDSTSVLASTLQARSVSVVAGNDVLVRGSDIEGQTSALVAADNHLTVESAQNTRSESHDRQDRTTGFLQAPTRLDVRARSGQGSQAASLTQQASSIASGGDTTLLAGGRVTVYASELGAGRTLTMQGAEVVVQSGLNTASHSQYASERRSGGDLSPQRPGEGINARSRTDYANAGTTLAAAALSGASINLRATGSGMEDGRIALGAARIDLTGEAGRLVVDAGRNGTIDLNLVTTTLSTSSGRSNADLAYQRNHDRGSQTEAARYTEINVGADRIDWTGQVSMQVERSSADARTLAQAPVAAQAAAVAEAAAVAAEARAAASEQQAARDRQADPIRADEAAAASTQQAALDRQAALDLRSRATEAALDAQTARAAANAVPTLQQTARTLAQQPGLGYLGALVNDPRLQDPAAWRAVELASHQWDHNAQGLTPAGAVIVAAVVTYFTAGAGSSIAGSLAGTGGTAAATTATTAVATTATTTAAATSFGTIAANVAFSTLASQAAVSLVNNQGNVGRTLNDLGSRESVRALVVSVLSAGIASQLTQALGLPTGTQLAGADFGTQLRTYATQALTSAGVQVAVNGGSLSDAARNALITALGQTLTTQIGDVAQAQGVAAGDVVKVLAHAGVQCAQAQLTNRDCASAAIGGATAELLAPLTERIDAPRDALNPATQRWGELVASLGAAVAAVATGHDAATALAASQQVDAYNRQLHPRETMRIQQLAQGDAEREARLTAAACALVRCADGVPSSDPNYAYLRGLQEAGAGYMAEQTLLRQQTGQVGRAQQTLFGYDPLVDTAQDWLSQNNVGTRAAGAVQAVGGAGLIAAGGAGCTTGIGCTLGAASIVFGADQLQAGARTIASGQPTLTQGELVLQGLGMSPEAAAVSYAMVGSSPAAAEAMLASRAANATSQFNALARASYATDFATHGIQATPEVMATPQAQALIREIQAGSPGLSSANAERYAADFIRSGSTLPDVGFAAADTTVIKVVPRGDMVSPYTGYWMTPQQAQAIATMTPAEAARALGLPASQAARMQLTGLDYYAITPRPGVTPTLFTSDVARATQGGIALPGGAQQVIVPNRTQWTDPVPISPTSLISPKSPSTLGN